MSIRCPSCGRACERTRARAGGGSSVRPVRGWSADDLARLQARRAHIDALRRLADHHAHALDVRVEAPLGTTVRVRHVVSERGTLVADLTYGSHRNSSERTQLKIGRAHV